MMMKHQLTVSRTKLGMKKELRLYKVINIRILKPFPIFWINPGRTSVISITSINLLVSSRPRISKIRINFLFNNACKLNRTNTKSKLWCRSKYLQVNKSSSNTLKIIMHLSLIIISTLLQFMMRKLKKKNQLRKCQRKNIRLRRRLRRNIQKIRLKW